ncbi:hypothetical protein L198_04361 [Cryptococcus wingfieldii CBS 7118]|uniref:SAP domain-containing protein n=1 Tax=Cryptococcus wingfieldii CBS 7118 TaxID=1295528 RepID=A0A1E3J4H5_9TREE|nr:hypothetical protein L198_04361 [Cryptococcus wingfieldii CBS 7118]ODN95743.1 hypothetical protein L198_04361 [Cryptococcus wingfieldii CBS 7118]
MSDDILRNSAALNALKRHQLVSLSKKYGLRASGKNVEMIGRLQVYADDHAGDLDFYIPEPAPTPARPLPAEYPIPSATSPAPSPDHLPQILLKPKAQLNHKESFMSTASRLSNSWDVLSEGNASLISKMEDVVEEEGEEKYGSMGSWKSANNGEPLNEFGGEAPEHVKRNSSMKAFASSISKRGSLILLGRSDSSSSNRAHGEPGYEPPADPETVQSQPAEEQQEMIVDTPPSPASTVGVPRRHSRHTLQERPSTIRLCSPAPFQATSDSTSDHSNDDLPFVGKARDLKERRSMAPLRSPAGAPSLGAFERKSMPALPYSNSASVGNVYPSLPTMPVEYASLIRSSESASDATPIPGAFPPLPPTPGRAQILFGDRTGTGVSNHQFSEAAQAVLKEMNAKLPQGSFKFGEELLKGRDAELAKLVQVNKDVGTGGWGLSGGGLTQDRYAEAHQKEFAKMRSISKSSIRPGPSRTASSGSVTRPYMIPLAEGSKAAKRKLAGSTSTLELPSAPNGLPLHSAEEDVDSRQSKRTRLSTHPLGSLRGAKKSLANMLGEEKGLSQHTPRKQKDRKEKRASMLGRGNSMKFPFLKKKSTLGPDSLSASSSLPSISHPRALPRTLPSGPETGASNTPLSSSTHKRLVQHSTDNGQSQKDRGRSTSAQTMMSQASGRTPKRSRIPDFVPPLPSAKQDKQASLDATNTLGLPKSSSVVKSTTSFVTNTSSTSAARAYKRQSQMDLLRNARPAPLPPAPVHDLQQKSKASSATSASLDRALSSFVLAPETKPKLPSSFPQTAEEYPRVPSSSSTRSLITPAAPRPQAASNPNRHSTLFQPTAASLARMQATVKPRTDRPLPTLPSTPSAMVQPAIQPTQAKENKRENGDIEVISPSISFNTIQPFGNASSRENAFESNFMSKPSPSNTKGSLNGKSSTGPKTTLMKKGSTASISAVAARNRARSNGLSAVKSRGDLRDKEQDMKRRKEEMKATMERRKEERELRELLGM